MLCTQMQTALLVRRCFSTSARASNIGDLPLPNAKGTFDKQPASSSTKVRQSSSPQGNNRGGGPPQGGNRPSLGASNKQRHLQPSVLRTSAPRTNALPVQHEVPTAPLPQTAWEQSHFHLKTHPFTTSGPGVPVLNLISPDGRQRKPLRIPRRSLLVHASSRRGQGVVLGPAPRKSATLSEADEKAALHQLVMQRVGGDAQPWTPQALLTKPDEQKAHILNAAHQLSSNADIAPEGRKWLVDKIRELAP